MVSTAVFLIEIDRLFLVAVFVPSHEHGILVDWHASEEPFLLFRLWYLAAVFWLATFVTFG